VDLRYEKTREGRWLWRYEDGLPGKINKWLGESDIVLTAPNYFGELRDKQDLDNQYNVAFAHTLENDERFTKPAKLRMGRFQR
jgi:hypothetical protein